ncbi:hypothetical protein QTP88_023077 [Uroleucon formosanum]
MLVEQNKVRRSNLINFNYFGVGCIQQIIFEPSERNNGSMILIEHDALVVRWWSFIACQFKSLKNNFGLKIVFYDI